MRHCFPDMQFRVDACVAQLAMDQHAVGEEQVARAGLDKGGREALAKVCEKRRQIWIAQIMSVGIGGVRLRQAGLENDVEFFVGSESVAGLGQIHLGGEASGGLTLANDSKLNVGANTLLFKKQSAVNAGNENGRIGINGGNILFTSTSALSSKLYFDPAANAINRFEVDLSGAGNIVVRESGRVTNGLKIRRGTIDANGQLTMASTATKTANLEMIENNGQVTGNLKVERYIAPEGRNWKYISSPVAG